jgi:hypothetical protein
LFEVTRVVSDVSSWDEHLGWQPVLDLGDGGEEIFMGGPTGAVANNQQDVVETVKGSG